MLDACRDNPFEAQAAAPAASNRVASAGGPAAGARSLNQSLGKDRGLAPIRIDHSTLVFFAAKEGQAALDGDGDDSPFAVAMIQRLATPAVEINTLFRLVRDDVMEADRRAAGALCLWLVAGAGAVLFCRGQMTHWSGVAAAVFCASKLGQWRRLGEALRCSRRNG